MKEYWYCRTCRVELSDETILAIHMAAAHVVDFPSLFDDAEATADVCGDDGGLCPHDNWHHRCGLSKNHQGQHCGNFCNCRWPWQPAGEPKTREEKANGKSEEKR